MKIFNREEKIRLIVSELRRELGLDRAVAAADQLVARCMLRQRRRHVEGQLVERGAQLGLTAQDIGFALNVLVDGVKVSEYQYEGKAIDHREIVVSPNGERVTLGHVEEPQSDKATAKQNRLGRKAREWVERKG